MSIISPPQKPDFSSAVLKVERANRHIADFDDEATRFFSRGPYDVRQESELEEDRHGYHLFERIPFPERRLALIVGDAVHNLRSALDHLIAACADAYGRTFNDTKFLIVDDHTKADRLLFDKLLKGACRKAGVTAVNLVRDLNAGSNGLLWAIHKIDLADKHQLVQPVACSAQVTIQTGAFNGLPVASASGSLYSLERKSQFVAAPAGYKTSLAHDFSFTFEVIFARGTVLAEKPCLDVLQEMSGAVTRIIALFETTFGCIRLSDSLKQHLPPVTSDI